VTVDRSRRATLLRSRSSAGKRVGSSLARLTRTIRRLDGQTELSSALSSVLKAAVRLAEAIEGYAFLERQGQADEAINIYASVPALPEISIRGRLSHLSRSLGRSNRPAKVGTLSIFPLNARQQRIGAILVRLKAQGRLNKDQFAALELLAAHSALLFDNLVLSHNEWTRLPNLSAIKPQIAAAIGKGKRPVALLFVDIDDFKGVNSSVGYLGGAELLIQLSQRLQKSPPLKRGKLAHISGDEFLLLLSDAPDIKRLAIHAVHALRRCFKNPFSIGGFSLPVTASIGISVFPDDAGSMTELLDHSGRAALVAKRSGKGAYRFFRVGWDRLLRLEDFFEQG